MCVCVFGCVVEELYFKKMKISCIKIPIIIIIWMWFCFPGFESITCCQHERCQGENCPIGGRDVSPEKRPGTRLKPCNCCPRACQNTAHSVNLIICGHITHVEPCGWNVSKQIDSSWGDILDVGIADITWLSTLVYECLAVYTNMQRIVQMY